MEGGRREEGGEEIDWRGKGGRKKGERGEGRGGEGRGGKKRIKVGEEKNRSIHFINSQTFCLSL